MNTKELVAAVAARTGLPVAQAEGAVAALLDTIATQVGEGKKVMLAGFGTFEVRERAARVGRNPRTGEAIDIPSGRSCGFRPASKLKAAVTRTK